jgi:hypothetical protein
MQNGSDATFSPSAPYVKEAHREHRKFLRLLGKIRKPPLRVKVKCVGVAWPTGGSFA